MRKQERFDKVLSYLAPIYGDVETELRYRTPFELLVAVVLSAQCTDKRVNMVTPELFKSFPVPELMAKESAETILPYIKSVSYPNSKAKHLAGLSKMLVEKFNSQVPQTMEELTQLPGVGRKTANVIQAIIFGKAALAVDTHVYRVSHRLGLAPKTANTPYKVEIALKKYIPEEKVGPSHFWLLLHGRYVCTARNPHCKECGLAYLCIGIDFPPKK